MRCWPVVSLVLGLMMAGLAGACSPSEGTPGGATPEGTVYRPPTVALRQAAEGDTVTVRYRGYLDDGSVFETSDNSGPFIFVIGSGQAISGFDKAIRGLSVGGTATFTVQPDEAYGQHVPELVVDVPSGMVLQGLKAGDWVRLADGTPARVVDVTPEAVRVDANHWLAGKALTFDVVVQAIG